MTSLSEIFSDGLMWIHASGRIDDKASMLEQFAAGNIRVFQLDRSEVVIRIYGKTAVVTGSVEMDAEVNHVRKSQKSRFTGVWFENDGQTRLVSWQSALTS